jgi:hypothetical protein
MTVRAGQEATMTDAPGNKEPAMNAAAHGRRFRRHQLELADGGRLVIGVDGLIARLDAAGATTQSWTPDDPGWPDQAIRFGLRPQARTVTPQGRRVQGPKSPG